ncbi:unnamed protein product [Calypogeia fissa]
MCSGKSRLCALGKADSGSSEKAEDVCSGESEFRKVGVIEGKLRDGSQDAFDKKLGRDMAVQRWRCWTMKDSIEQRGNGEWANYREIGVDKCSVTKTSRLSCRAFKAMTEGKNAW